MISALGLAALGLLGAAILYFERTISSKRTAVAAAALIALAMLLRGVCMSHETLDYQNFLTVWVDYFRDNGGFAALRHSIGNYNVPYLYFLAAFSYLDIAPLVPIKLLSVFFDIMLAWGVMRIVYLFRPTAGSVLSAFFITLFLPTVVLNGAYWGQCDSIYAAFAVWSIYFALSHHPILSMVFIALSFSFKLQAVFIMPVFLVFIFAGRIKWRHLPVFALGYVGAMLPAVAAGRPFWDTLTVYFNQASSVGSALNYNSSSVFAFVSREADGVMCSRLGIAAAFAFLILIFVWTFFTRERLTDRTLLAVTLLIALGVPFFLPHMHDRYFFISDVLSVALAVVVPQLAIVPLCVSFGSLLGYYAYLVGRFLLPMRYGAAAMVLAMVLVFAYILLFRDTRPARKPERRKR